MPTIRNESSFLAEHASLPDELVLAPGVTAGDMRAMYGRPAIDPDGSRFISSVAYSSAAGDVGQMALYARNDPRELAPMVLFVHGGGFIGGHHFTAIRYAAPLAARGYVTATMTYRFGGEAPWPASLEDTKCAVRWLRHHASDLGGDPSRIVMVGDSAGGHLSAMTALTPGEYEGDGGWHDVSSAIQGALLFYPAVDLTAAARNVVEVQGNQVLFDYFGDDIANASPVNRVHESCPPILTLTGSADRLTTLAEITTFHDRLEAAGVRQRLEVFPDADHSFDFLPAQYERCLTMIEEFLVETVARPAGRAA
jgi:acetyl esterase/lipase